MRERHPDDAGAIPSDKTGQKPGEGLPRTGLRVRRYFSRAGIDPFDTVAWDLRDARIVGENGEAVFEQPGVEFPHGWSMIATTVVASKYFHGTPGSGARESSLRQLIGRVVGAITGWGAELGYFASTEDAAAFHDELKHILLYQIASFNSPVWFNVGIDERPQCSACFINSVEDRMESILQLAKTEGMLFKFGSGSGTNLSPIRSSREPLSGGGIASGPVSFMKGFDAFAGVIKSGGKTRRAAKMVILNVDHPDIEAFIASKADEEKKAGVLIAAGYDPSLDGEAYESVFYQNANHSVRVTDEFMEAVVADEEWGLRSVATGEVVERCRARDLFGQIARAAHTCGDPGLQFDTATNLWHTVPQSGRINASNPCSEYLFLDDSACNLSSMNLMALRTRRGDLDVDAFCHTVSVMVLAQEILVDCSSYPTERIARNSYDFRPLGLGYANLGSFLMARGYPYDSETGRQIAGAITALMTGQAYKTSAEIASMTGPFRGFAPNRESMLGVLARHRSCLARIDPSIVPEMLIRRTRAAWDEAIGLGEQWGFRNAQTTVLAPTGTIAFMMDCDTTGIEPDIALVKYKRLAGGGVLKIVNRGIEDALENLGYDDAQRKAILTHLDEEETIEGAPRLREEHLSVFDCAFRPKNGHRSISPSGHLRMMAAVQPFLSGGVSKTINLPHEATVEEIERTYIEAWRLGLKSIAVYRDGCKRSQPLNTDGTRAASGASPQSRPIRERLPDERRSITHKFSIQGHEGYVTAGLYEDGRPGEIFVVMAKEGSVVSGLVDCFATAVSIALQYGVPLPVLVRKFVHTRFEPAGVTLNPEIRFARSIADYIFRWLALKFLPSALPEDREEEPRVLEGRALSPDESEAGNGDGPRIETATATSFEVEIDAPPCPVCGSLMIRTGRCERCLNCGTSNGCSG